MRAVLAHKREALEQEIAEYRAAKEEEYRQYELELQQQKENLSEEAIPVKGFVNRTELLGNKRGSENGVGRSGDAESRCPHEREIEFHGIFTPNYLPLLEISRIIEGVEDTALPASRLHESSISLNQKRPLPPATLSVSDITPAATDNAPGSIREPQSRSDSLSPPRALPGSRSSPRADTPPTHRRSSLRQPKSPRSSKHVLFAIDNTVLSPSTSPAVQRSDNAPPAPLSELPNNVESTRERKTMGGSHGENCTAQKSGALVAVIDKNPIRQPHVLSPKTIKSYIDLVAPLVSSPSLGGDEFERVQRDDDALFSFDEDVDVIDNEKVGSLRFEFHGAVKLIQGV